MSSAYPVKEDDGTGRPQHELPSLGSRPWPAVMFPAC